MKRSEDVRILEADPWSLAKAFAEKYKQGNDRDIGDIYSGILDIIDATVHIYGKILPNIAKLESPSEDDLLGGLIDLELELKHLQDHARDAIRGIRHLSEDVREPSV